MATPRERVNAHDSTVPGLVVACIEGPVGSGKSKLLSVIEGMDLPFAVVTAEEPVDVWKEKGYLAAFYEDMKGRAFMFQVAAISSRKIRFMEKYRAAQELSRSQFVLLVAERSNVSDQIFARINHEDGNMDAMEHEVYTYFVRGGLEVDAQPIDCHVYVNPGVDVCMQRIAARSRSEEEGIPRTYMEKLQAKHDEVFAQRPVPVIQYDSKECATELEFEDAAYAVLDHVLRCSRAYANAPHVAHERNELDDMYRRSVNT